MIRPYPIISLYMGRHFLTCIIGTLGLLLVLIFVGDTIELLRRAGPKPNATLDVVLTMAVLKLPHMVEKVLPFAILFGSMFAFWKQAKNRELVAMRAAGVSVWQFLAAPLAAAAGIGIVHVIAFNPLASAMMTKFEQMENEYLRGRPSVLNISQSGLWLRQATENGQAVIHAGNVRSPDQALSLGLVTVFEFSADNDFIRRIEAEHGELREGQWRFANAWSFTPDAAIGQWRDFLQLATPLTFDKIQDSFASPQTMSFWDIAPFIRLLEEAGFSALRHAMHYHTLLSSPLLLTAMVLVAAIFSIRYSRRGGVGILIGGGVMGGFMVFFFSDITNALGVSGNLPVVMAAWLPAGVTMLIGVASLLHLEDG